MFDILNIPVEFPFILKVKELLREVVNIDTYDSRNTLGYIKGKLLSSETVSLLFCREKSPRYLPAEYSRWN